MDSGSEASDFRTPNRERTRVNREGHAGFTLQFENECINSFLDYDLVERHRKRARVFSMRDDVEVKLLIIVCCLYFVYVPCECR